MEKLVTGVRHFRTGHFSRLQQLYERLAHEQRPEALFITCSDSRILPNRLTQTEPGELFVIRNAGNMMPKYHEAKAGYSGEAATLQYAVEVLGVKDVIVCGHTDCGAVRALMDPPEALAKLDLVAHWVAQGADLRELVQRNYSHLPPERLHIAAVEENVLGQVNDLQSYPFVKERVEAGTLQLHGWVYHIVKGIVFAFDHVEQQFLPIEKVYPTASGDLEVRPVQPAPAPGA